MLAEVVASAQADEAIQLRGPEVRDRDHTVFVSREIEQDCRRFSKKIKVTEITCRGDAVFVTRSSAT